MCSHSIVSQQFMEPEGPLPRSQELSICTDPVPDHVKWGPLTPQNGASTGCGWRDGHQLWIAANILNTQPRTNDMGWSSSLRVERGANNTSS
jgi:hypothetical protein